MYTCSICNVILTSKNCIVSYLKKGRYCRSCDTRQRSERRRLKNIGITPEEFKKMLIDQCGKCAICNRPMTVVCADHDHKTGRVRDLLCSSCNKFIGLANEDVEILANAIQYLHRHMDEELSSL